MNLQDLANGVRGSAGTITIPTAEAERLKLKEVEETANGACRVKCEELVAAVDAVSEKAAKQADKPAGKPASGNRGGNRGGK